MFTIDPAAVSPFHGVRGPSGAAPAVALPVRHDFWRAAITTTGHEPETAPILLTLKEASKALRISSSKMYDLIRSGQLRTVQIGRRRLVPVASIDAFVSRDSEGRT